MSTPRLQADTHPKEDHVEHVQSIACDARRHKRFLRADIGFAFGYVTTGRLGCPFSLDEVDRADVKKDKVRVQALGIMSSRL